MPRKLFDEKGEPIEVLDDNEIQALKEKAQAIETLEAQYKQKEELLAKEIEELKEGMNTGLKPELMFEIRTLEYNGQPTLKHNNIDYEVMRTYDKGEFTELIVSRNLNG